jgi:Tol biopolymer transport system component/pimeloyl-ACP methyl ester carboxylesterase
MFSHSKKHDLIKGFTFSILVTILLMGCGRVETITTSPIQTNTPIQPTLTSSLLPTTYTEIPTNTQIPATNTPTALPTTTLTPTMPPYEVLTELTYTAGNDPDRSLSIYLPTTARRNLTLLVAGGDYYPSMLRYFAEIGYPVIAFNTRGGNYQEEIRDGFCALAWAHANADTYGFNPAGLIPVGGSMWGGNVALLGMVNDPIPFLEGCTHTLPEIDRVRAVITLAGVFDYSVEADFFEGFIESIRDFMGGTPEQAPGNWAAASAITWVQGDEPPFLLIHGEADTNVASHQSEIFAAALEEVGSNVELVILPDITHYTNMTDQEVYEAIASYLAHLDAIARLSEVGAETFAFVSNRDGDYEIYLRMIPTVSDDPAAQVQLTHNEVDDSVPDWSPDGGKIAFASRRDGNWEIYVMEDVNDAIQNPGNTEVRRLTNHEGDDLLPAWSPDGQQIAFASDRDGDWEIYVMQADGSGLRQLTDNTSYESKPSWSPDGAKIAYDSGEGFERDIYVMDSDGTNQERIIQASGGWPAWSPVDNQIAYFDRVDGNPEIYIVNLDGTNQTRLTINNRDDWEPSWSADGKWLLYVSGMVPDVVMMRADGTETHYLTQDNFEDWSPVWRPGK